jgi:hypothetical protein
MLGVTGKCHGMRHMLETVFKTSVVLAIQMLVVTVGYVHECIGIVTTFAAIVDFKFHAYKQSPLSTVLAEDGLFFKAILAHSGFVHIVIVFLVERLSVKFAFCHVVSPLC